MGYNISDFFCRDKNKKSIDNLINFIYSCKGQETVDKTNLIDDLINISSLACKSHIKKPIRKSTESGTTIRDNTKRGTISYGTTSRGTAERITKKPIPQRQRTTTTISKPNETYNTNPFLTLEHHENLKITNIIKNIMLSSSEIDEDYIKYLKDSLTTLTDPYADENISITPSRHEETYYNFFYKNNLLIDDNLYYSFKISNPGGSKYALTFLYLTKNNDGNFIILDLNTGYDVTNTNIVHPNNDIIDKKLIIKKLYRSTKSINLTEKTSTPSTPSTLSPSSISVIQHEDNYSIRNSNTTGGYKKSSKFKTKKVLGKLRRVYRIPNSKKEHIKHKGKLITVSDYKILMKLNKR